jgi:tetratricopeptide (TPR) repeat protein
MPNHPDAYLFLARAQLNSGNLKAADAPISTLVRAFPDNAHVLAELGRLQLARGEVAVARTSFERSLARDPKEINAIRGLAIIDLSQKNGAAARKRVEQAAAAFPKDAGIQVLLGRVYIDVKDQPAAERALKQAIQNGAVDLEAYSLLAGLYYQQGKLAEAAAEFDALAKRQPRTAGIPAMVGLLLHLQGKLDDAKIQYEKALALDPHAAAAANNLAQLYADRNQNLEVALDLAKRAKAGMPDAHEVDDTLGWIYYKKGNGLQAVQSLKAAVSAQPENATYLYHLGAAYALNNDKVNARQALEKALSKGKFDGADDARRVLESLNKG